MTTQTVSLLLNLKYARTSSRSPPTALFLTRNPRTRPPNPPRSSHPQPTNQPKPGSSSPTLTPTSPSTHPSAPSSTPRTRTPPSQSRSHSPTTKLTTPSSSPTPITNASANTAWSPCSSNTKQHPTSASASCALTCTLHARPTFSILVSVATRAIRSVRRSRRIGCRGLVGGRRCGRKWGRGRRFRVRLGVRSSAWIRLRTTAV